MFIPYRDGKEWLTNRKIMNKLMLRRDTTWTKMPAHLSANRLLQQIAPQNNNRITIENLENLLYRWSVDGLMHMMVGEQSTDILDPMIDIFATQIKQIFQTSAQLQFVELSERNSSWIEFVKSVTETLDYARHIMNVVMNKMDLRLGMLGDMHELGMNRENIERIFVDLIIAAGDTTAFSMQWVLYEVAKSRQLQERIRQEMRAYSQNSVEDDKYETSLIKATIRETMRLYPVAPFIGRLLESDAILGHFRIPKDVSLENIISN